MGRHLPTPVLSDPRMILCIFVSLATPDCDLYYSKPVTCESRLTPQFPELLLPLVGGERDVSWHEPRIDGASATHIKAFVVTRDFILTVYARMLV
jgi:hypothetical protein